MYLSQTVSFACVLVPFCYKIVVCCHRFNLSVANASSQVGEENKTLQIRTSESPLLCCSCNAFHRPKGKKRKAGFKQTLKPKGKGSSQISRKSGDVVNVSAVVG